MPPNKQYRSVAGLTTQDLPSNPCTCFHSTMNFVIAHVNWFQHASATPTCLHIAHYLLRCLRACTMGIRISSLPWPRSEAADTSVTNSTYHQCHKLQTLLSQRYTPSVHHDVLVPSRSLVSAGAVYKQQVERLSGLIEASKARPYPEQERLWRELQALVSKASRDRCPLPQADDLLQDLKASQVSLSSRALSAPAAVNQSSSMFACHRRALGNWLVNGKGKFCSKQTMSTHVCSVTKQ